MTKQEIEYLISTIPPDVELPYLFPRALIEFSDVKGEARDILQKSSWLVSQPDFGWNYCKAFSSRNKALPTLGDIPPDKADWLRSMNDIQLGAYNPEDEVHLAVMTARSLMSYNLDVIREGIMCLLMDKDWTCEMIGNFFHLPALVIRVFDQLFFNAKDRIHEPDYMLTLAYPSRDRSLAVLNPDYLYSAPMHEKYMHEALTYGSKAVLMTMKLLPRPAMDAEEVVRQFNTNAVIAGVEEQRLGGGHGVYHASVQASRLIQADKMSGKDQKGLEATRGIEKFSSLYPVWDTVKRVAQPALDMMIEESQGESESTRKLQTLGQIERDAKIAADQSVKTHKPDPDWAKKGWQI